MLINNSKNHNKMLAAVLSNESIPVIEDQNELSQFNIFLIEQGCIGHGKCLNSELHNKGFLTRFDEGLFLTLFQYEEYAKKIKLGGGSLYEYNFKKYNGVIEKEYIKTDTSNIFVSQYSREIHFLNDEYIKTLLNNEQLEEAFDQSQNNMVTSPETVSEEHWFDMLECLPPCNWHNVNGFEVFYMSEFDSGNITTWYAKKGDNHYSFKDFFNLNDDQLAQKLKGC